ncbi:MAG: VOC family protein [Clostridiales bacterium]|nr:VOC family protein [Clostridiales bacterium]
MRLGSIALMVKSMDKMVAFYRDVVGFPIQWDGSGFTGVKLPNGMYFNLCARELMDPECKFSYPEGINGTMEINISFDSIEEVDREYNRYIQCGAKEIQKPIARVYGIYESFVADPEGNLIELNCGIDE